jgi:prevent-host-death family protein
VREVGILEAKTQLSALIKQEVADGREVVITSHGRPVAKLVPVSSRPRTTPEAIAAAQAFQEELAKTWGDEPFDWKAARDEGRK